MTRMIDRSAVSKIDRAAVILTLLLPLLLLHGRGIADGDLSIIGALFLVQSGLRRDWRWLRRGWVRAVLLWWGWLVLCSLRGGTLIDSLFVIRLPLLAAALETWILGDARVREWLARLLRWAAFYLAAQCLLQFATGRNLFGWPRGPDGELTGAYKNPRAGGALAQLLYPAVLPLAGTPIRGLLLLSGSVILMVMIGQRMPLLLTFLGLVTTAVLLPRLRLPVLVTAVAAGALLAALPAISPQAAHRLESKFAAQLEHLTDDQYGQLYARSLAMVRSSPIMGVGFDGFRHRCDDPRYFEGWRGDDGGGAAICAQHPHSYYLQATVEGGLVGLVLFATMTFTWLRTIGRGLWREPDLQRVGLFAAALIQVWPFASSTDWVAMPLSGWFFLQLGLALALARPYMPGQQISFEA